jgi:hypothetical protein
MTDDERAIRDAIVRQFERELEAPHIGRLKAGAHNAAPH